ncbi:MAG: helix-turn-helix domain-containing protein [Janthinobacterium lividum]
MPALARVSAIPSEAEATLARETKQALSLRLSGTPSLDLLAMDVASKPTIRIPAPAARLLVQILDEMGQGNAVKLIPVHPELTTQEAAELLNVSRPTLIQLLREGQIEFRKVGTHRRVRLDSLMTYKKKLYDDRLAALAELSAYDQELGI